MHAHAHSSERGFTLIELMITVAIVAILAAVAYPSFTEQIARSRRSECRSGALATMQQQERYFGQYNTYVVASVAPAAAVVKNFSGDNATNSACYIASSACAGRTIAECVQVQANVLYKDPHKIDYFTVTSEGVRECSVNGAVVSSDAKCW